MPYQQHVWDVALETNPDGSFRYKFIDLTIMRQSGKTTLQFAKSTWRLTVAPTMKKPDGKPWGRQRALYTAQRGKDGRKKLEQEFAVVLREATPSFREIRNVKARPVRPYEWKLSMNNGAEHLLFGAGNYFLIEAPVKDAGHSDSLDDANLDEIWALQTDEVEQGMGPTQATRWNAQMWRFSTAGDRNSFYLYSMVRAGRAKSCVCRVQFMHECTCGFAESQDPEDRTAYFEWSIPDDANIDDEDVWWDHMPALGRTIPVEFVRSELAKARRKTEEGGEDVWRRGYGNQWTEIPLIGGELRVAKLPLEEWADAVVDETPVRKPGEVVFAFDVAPGGEWSTIVVASGTQSSPYVEITGDGVLHDHRQETGWLPARLVDLVREWKPKAIGFDQAGPAGALGDLIREALNRAGLNSDVVKPLTSAEYKAACGAFFLDVKEARLRRADQGPLDAAGRDATERKVMDAWVWDRRSAQVPICPLVAATCARALLPIGKRPVFAA